MSPDEAERLLAMAGNLKVHAMLALGYGCGMVGHHIKLKSSPAQPRCLGLATVHATNRNYASGMTKL
jgi:hypothetical protein